METINFVQFAVPYARRADGTEMRRNEAQEAREKGLRIPSLVCPACGHGVAYRQEHARARGHFYHSDSSVGGGGCGLESEIHAVFKAAVAAELTENGLDTGLIRGWGGRGGALRGTASVEERVMDGAFRLDVSFHPEGVGLPPIAIEIVNMSALDSGKRDALQGGGLDRPDPAAQEDDPGRADCVLGCRRQGGLRPHLVASHGVLPAEPANATRTFGGNRTGEPERL